MTNKNVFCNTPWYELHIYWDGSLGICCQEDHKLYSDGQWNIADTTVMEWFNSEPVRKFRMDILGSRPVSACRRCYEDEKYNGHSRRLKSNHKSAIFTQTAFDASFAQSPGHKHFMHSAQNQGHSETWPIDLHVDLGNHCNLACKMCHPRASTTIASQQVRWGMESSRQYLGVDWTKNTVRWHAFLDELARIPGLKNIHFMGGETLLSPRLEQLVDYFSALGRYDLCLSFVTNGTAFNSDLMHKLLPFERVGIEVSIETLDSRNAYQRQGTDTQKVLDNIAQYRSFCNGSSITVALRPAPSALTVGGYADLLRWAVEQNLIVKANLCFDPAFLHATVLPKEVKQLYLPQYQTLLADLGRVSDMKEFNASDPHNSAQVAAQQAAMIVSVLQSPDLPNQNTLLSQMVDHCRRWDRVYGLDARTVYPELAAVWDRYDY